MLTHGALSAEPRRIRIDGVAIATWVMEPACSAVGDVVLCHGTPWSSAVWADVARELSHDHRVFLWDMPGYGESDTGPGVATALPVQSARLAALLQTWGLRSPHVVAHDIGGAVALGAHLLGGVDYADLFLWDVVTLDPWGSPFFRLVAEHADVFTRLPSALHRALLREYIAGAVPGGLPAADADTLAAPWLGGAGQRAFYAQIASLSPDDTRPVAESLGRVRCPTRIGWGRDDPWIPLGQAYELQSLLPRRPEVVVLDGVGHLSPWEAPSAVSAAVRAWVDRGWGGADASAPARGPQLS
ncbi:alpha/beta fold hydrolase [Mycetocola reblochoni]|uniref:Possible oxidoreductase n=2 Tax=Mycetocola reblochoni TaxID=331618 RepID=A0A1R4IS92_9MICO|nr:alpha/beta hydrolase [Mycetocola reblochoni]RLP71127.1 alpha/beta hydrolase [Mycetocola reblochoni]SJN22445.1 Possible oxidoreductase [Mycetocola reblochoni REB411]